MHSEWRTEQVFVFKGNVCRDFQHSNAMYKTNVIDLLYYNERSYCSC